MSQELIIKLLSEKSFTFSSIFFRKYKQLGITDLEFLLLLHIHQYNQEGLDFPTPDRLAERMTESEEKCAEMLRNLMSKRFISIHDHENQKEKISEWISIEPLFEKLALLLGDEMSSKDQSDNKLEEGIIFRIFEKEFGRPLSPMELEMISMWIDEDEHSSILIKGALREAVVSGKLNFRYIDRILHDWKRNNIKTLDQAKAHGEKVRNKIKPTAESNTTKTKTTQKHPRYNWLEGE